MKNVRLSEIFTSVEGEGILYGTKTLFVRLAGCPFSCFYCDTPESLPLDSGTEYTISEAAQLIDDSLQDHTYKVNFTGGDPLIQHEAVSSLAEHTRGKGVLTYLESSCFDSRRFEHVLPHIDIAKIEFKTRDSEFVDAQHYGQLHEQAVKCLALAVSAGRTVYIKIIVSSKTTIQEMSRMASTVFDTVKHNDISGFVIQPVYGRGAPSLELLLAMYDAVRPIYADVRVIPQLHKLINAP